MAISLHRWRRGAEPQGPGPRGRILFVGPFNGGLGGMERLTRIFADWAEGSGFTATMVLEKRFPDGPFTVNGSANVRVLEGRAWGRALEDARYDFLYAMPAGLSSRRWLPRLARVQATRVLLDLDAKRRWTPSFHVLHCEAPRAAALPIPSVVATPDPRPTIRPGPPEAAGDFHLTVFTPYGPVKGHDRIPAFLEATGKPLVWCYAPQTFARRKRRWNREIRARVEEVRHPLLRPVDTATQDEIYRLYRRCAGYVCFSRDETLGFSMLDAIALGRPLCADRVGVCRGLDGFRPTTDFSRPVFGTYALPPLEGYEGLFREVPRVLAAT